MCLFCSEANQLNESENQYATTDGGFSNVTADFSMCGANHCSTWESDTKFEEKKYTIKNFHLRLALFVFYGTLQVIAMLIHIFLLNDAKANQLPKLDSSLQEALLQKLDQKEESSKLKWVKFDIAVNYANMHILILHSFNIL